MISKILFENKLGKKQGDYIYSEEYVEFLITKFLFLKHHARMEDIYEFLIKNIKADLVKKSALKRFLNEKFDNIKNYYYLKLVQNENIAKTLDMRKEMNFIMFKRGEELCSKVSDEILNDDFYFDKTLLSMLMLSNKNVKIENNNYYLSKIYYIKNNYCNLIYKIKKGIESVDNFYNVLRLNDVITNKNIISVLSLNSINTIEDLIKYSPKKLLCIFSVDLNELFNLTNSIGVNHERMFQEIVYKFYSQLSEKDLMVFNCRFNYIFGKKSFTLEQIANKLEITRERVRQIEASTIRKLLFYMPAVKNLIKCIYIKLTNNNEQFFEVDRLCTYLKKIGQHYINEYANVGISTKNIAEILLIFMELGNSNIKYSRELRVIYNSDLISVEGITNLVVERLGKMLSPIKIKKMNSFELKIFNSEYKELKNGIYLKRGVHLREIYSEIIGENFRNGYSPGSQEDYNTFKKKFIEKYEIVEEIPSMHSLQAMLERSNYVLIGKGKYLPPELCPNMDDELVSEIINYIIDNKPTVFYRSIFEKFKYKLQKNGINNHYFLKGCLDKCLPEEFTTKRDYIMVGKVKITSAELIILYMHSFKREFGLKDLKDKFPGVKDYVFYNQIYKESSKGLIFTSSKTFIYFKYLNISNDTVDMLRNFITEQFKKMNMDIISSRKIYAKMSLTNKKLLEKLHLTHGQFTLFSLIKFLYPDLYYSRPLISTKVIEQKSSYALIKKYVQKFDEFNYNTILDYVSKMNITRLYSYLEFMDDMSDNYVQVNVDTMVRKEKLGITQYQLGQLNNLLDLIFDKYNELDTSAFKGYHILPKMPVPWNKYLLIGIIRSYLDEKFEVVNKSSTYSNTDYVIRRLNHE